MKWFFVFIMTLLASAYAVPASAERSTLVEQDAGCPVVLPIFNVPNTNVTVLDRSKLSKACLIALYEQNGDDKDDDSDDC